MTAAVVLKSELFESSISDIAIFPLVPRVTNIVKTNGFSKGFVEVNLTKFKHYEHQLILSMYLNTFMYVILN